MVYLISMTGPRPTICKMRWYVYHEILQKITEKIQLKSGTPLADIDYPGVT